MCRFVTATLPKDANLRELGMVLAGLDFALDVVRNDHVESQLSDGTIYFRPSRAYCDCETPLGAESQENQHATLADSARAQAAKLRRKGWSEAKIDRWLAQKVEATDRRAARRAVESPGTPGMDQWICLLNTVLASGHTQSIGLLLHFYAGSVTDEPITIERVAVCRLAELSAEVLQGMPENVLHEFSL